MEISLSDLPCLRYVAQVSNGGLRSKYSYLAMQRDLEVKLAAASWQRSSVGGDGVTTVVNKVTQTNLTYDEQGAIKSGGFTAYLSDAYDAYKQAGDGNTTTAMMCGYAGKALYRLTLPHDTNTITNLKLAVMLSKYARSGVLIRYCLSSSDTPSGISSEWLETETTEEASVVGVERWGLGGAVAAANLSASAARLVETTLDISWDLDTASDYYLWLEISLADQTDYWDYYSAGVRRQYCIEGSATLLLSASSITSTLEEYERPLVRADIIEELGGYITAGVTGRYGYLPRHIMSELGNGSFNNNSLSRPVAKPLPLEAAHAIYGDWGCPLVAGLFATDAASATREIAAKDIVGLLRRSNAVGVTFEDGGIVFDTANGIKCAAIADAALDARFGMMRYYPWVYSGGSIMEDVQTNLQVPHLRTFGVEVVRPLGSSTPFIAREQSNFVLMGANAFVVPSDQPSYTAAKIYGQRLELTGGVAPIGINIWRIKASQAHGRLDYAAVHALLKVRDAWLANAAQTLENAVTATGTDTTSTLSVSADLVGALSSYDGPTNSQYARSVQFTQRVYCGDILVLTPTIDALPTTLTDLRYSWLSESTGLILDLL